MFGLTLDNETKTWLKDFYKKEHTILEYGTGGSTFLALESNSKTKVYACETDRKWLDNVITHSKKTGCSDRLTPVYLNVGQTGNWGTPTGPITFERIQRFLRCSITPWKKLREINVDPNITFIDGRFRTACFLTTLLYIRKPTTIIWDDFGDRPHYDIFGDVIEIKEMVGRTVIFEALPNQYDIVEILSKYIHVYGDWR